MRISRRVLLCALPSLIVLICRPLPAAELTTSFFLYRDLTTYPSLAAAENALRTAPFIGSAFYAYQLTQGNERKYRHPPSTFFEDPRLVFTSNPWVACNECPIYDQFGNDRCTNQTGGDGCASEASWWAAVQQVYSGIDCPPVKTGEGPWVEGTKGEISYPMVFPEEYLMAQGSYTKFIDAEFPEGNWSSCGSDRNFTLKAISPVYCQGYPTFQWVAPASEYLCLDYNTEEILLLGAELAEPSESCSVGNPCHPTSGDKTLSEADFASPTLPFSRHYHSLQNYLDYAAMGRGWSHTYSSRLLDEAGQIKVIDGAGNAERFHCVDSPVCSTYSSESEAGQVLRPVTGGWELYLKSGELRHFDSSGKLDLVTHREGEFFQVSVSYDAAGRVAEVNDQFGRSLQFNYGSHGLVDSITLPDGQSILYDYAVPGSDTSNKPSYNLVKVTYQDFSERQYHYQDVDALGEARYAHLLTGITDENGNSFASYAYDDAARVVSSEHAGGAGRIELNYTKRAGESVNWSVTEVTLPLGETVTYAMEPGPYRKLTGVEDSRGTFGMSYDPASGWRTSSTDRAGNLNLFTYDALHEISRVESVGAAVERWVQTDWDNDINRITERREPGQSTSWTYNDRGQVLSKTIVDPATQATRTWSYSYFDAPALAPLIGRLKSIDGPRADVSDVTTYEYYVSDHPGGEYVAGDLKAVVNALGQRTEYLSYDGNGRPLESRDANGVLARVTYHPRGWVGSTSLAGQITLFEYDPAGNLLRFTEPDGNFIVYDYDAAHRLTAIADGMGNRLEFTLDPAGNRIAERTFNAGGMLRRNLGRVYDSLNRLQALLDGNSDPTAFDYDENGNRIEVTDANFHSTRYEYDALNRLRKTVDSVLGESLLSYDARDNLETASDPLGNITTFTYDGLDNHVALDSPDAGPGSHEYDFAGNRTASTDARGVRVEYEYDALNRLIEVVYPDSSLNVSVEYDAGLHGKGRLSHVEDAAGSVDYDYDERGNLVSEIRSMGGNLFMTRYAYNNGDRLVQITYPSGMVIDYSLDAAGRTRGVNQTLGSVTFDMVNSVQYEPFGPVVSFTYGNGMAFEARYDLDYELDELQSGDGLDWGMSFDPSGNLQAVDDRTGTQFDQLLSHDPLNRLEAAQGSWGSELFSYDANGNRLQSANDFVEIEFSYEAGSNRLASGSGWTFSRDAAGNRVAKLDPGENGYVYSYGDQNRLVRVDSLTGGIGTVAAEYEYDGQGRRASKTVAGEVRYFVYGPGGELLGEYESNGDPVSEFIYLNGRPVALYARQSSILPGTPLEIIVDNDESGTSSTGNWSLKSNKNDFGGNFRLGDKSDGYRWTPALVAGSFEVYAWWVPGKGYSKSAEYAIQHGGLVDTVVVNQSEGGGDWQLLGTLTFSGSGNEYVELKSGDGKKISADAIRFKQLVGGGDTVTTEGTYFIHTDHLGTPREVSNDEREIIWRWVSRPFGNGLPDENPDGDTEDFSLNLRFPGQYYDAESGLHYNYYRTYDPETGRYIESDPVGLQGGLNTFAYVGSDPLDSVDPFGLYQMCHRPVKGIVPGRHCYALFSNGSTSSFSKSGVGPETNVDHWDTKCTDDKDSQKDECIKIAMKQCAGNYDFIRFNCCHCVEQAMKECQTSIPTKDWPNFPINPGPQIGEPGYSPLPVYGPSLGGDE